jgi:hypothetical protein
MGRGAGYVRHGCDGPFPIRQRIAYWSWCGFQRNAGNLLSLETCVLPGVRLPLGLPRPAKRWSGSLLRSFR